MQLGYCSTGVDLIIVRSHCYLLVRLPLTLFTTYLQPRRRVARAPMTRSAEVVWADGWVGRWARGLVRPFFSLFSTPLPGLVRVTFETSYRRRGYLLAPGSQVLAITKWGRICTLPAVH